MKKDEQHAGGARQTKNKAFCNSCGKLVWARHAERDGKVYLAKDCPDCGTTEQLISSDAARYNTKRHLDAPHDYVGCGLNCLECKHKVTPSFLFMDITNRCNLNCPICINNTPSMGFLFEPPMEYFEKIFKHFSEFRPRPAVQLFGGEPTVRRDMFDIIALARNYGLPVRVVTNGIKLADEDYCRRLVESRATILIAYDGARPETYRVLRGNEKTLGRKQQAIENMRRIGKAKVGLMTCVAKGFNDDEIPEMFEFIHERRDVIRGVYFMPLAQTWDTGEFDLEPERVTTEDIEQMLDKCYPDDHIQFVPAGMLGNFPALMKCLRIKPPPFAGAHPNCESLYLLVSDGERYVPIGRYLRGSLPDLAERLFLVEERMARRLKDMDTTIRGRLLITLGLRRTYLWVRAALSLLRRVRGNVKFGALLAGRGLAKLRHATRLLTGLLFRRKSRRLLDRHTRMKGMLQIIVLPFEDKHILETERLERCPNAFVFVDPETDQVNTVPACAWSLHKNAVLRAIAERYNTASPAGAEAPD